MSTALEVDFRDSLRTVITTNARDWSTDRYDAWIYGIVVGWDRASFVELQARHRWSDGDVARLKAMHEQFKNNPASHQG